MGVRHLQTFVKEFVPNGTSPIDVIAECKKYYDDTGRKPVLVIDLLTLLNIFESDVKILLLGGRRWKDNKNFELFLKQLSSVAKLVFFKDGPLLDTKLETWVERHNNRYYQMIDVIDRIKNSEPLSSIAADDRKISRDSSNSKSFTHLAKQYGRVIVTVTRECDAELVQFANNEPDTLAVMSDDTDFLIFPGKWRFWSLQQLNPESITTIEYSRGALRTHLGLKDKEMKIFSTLAGNDFVRYDTVRPFHEAHCGGHRVPRKFMRIAGHVKSWRRMSLGKIVDEIISIVFEGDEEMREKVVMSLDQYSTDFPIPVETNPLLQFLAQNSMNFSYTVLTGSMKKFTTLYYDFRDDINYHYYNVTTNLYRKQIGILLKHLCAEPVRVDICSILVHNDGYRFASVTSHFPEHQLPPIIELLDRQNFPQHDDLRFKLLKWMIDENLKVEDFDKVPPQYFHDVLTLVFLKTNALITTTEADLLLLTLKHVELNLLPENLEIPEVVGIRPFQVAFLFIKFLDTVSRSLQVVGLKNMEKKLLNFDGLLFHTLYSKSTSSNFDPLTLLSDCRSFRLYDS